MPFGIDNIAILIELELTVAAVHHIASGVLQAEKTAAVDRHVERIAGGRNVALSELLSDGRNLGTQANRRRSGAGKRGGKDIGKLCRR